MKKILAIGASNSSTSINKQLASYIAQQIKDVQVIELDWEKIVLPVYGPDLEAEIGIPAAVQDFKDLVDSADGYVISLAEYNGMTTTAFKNLWDWTSRIEQKFWANKPLFLAATSPGGRGAQSALEIVTKVIPHYGGNIIVDFSLPFFEKNFSLEGIQDDTLHAELSKKINLYKKALENTPTKRT